MLFCPDLKPPFPKQIRSTLRSSRSCSSTSWKRTVAALVTELVTWRPDQRPNIYSHRQCWFFLLSREVHCTFIALIQSGRPFSFWKVISSRTLRLLFRHIVFLNACNHGFRFRTSPNAILLDPASAELSAISIDSSGDEDDSNGKLLISEPPSRIPVAYLLSIKSGTCITWAESDSSKLVVKVLHYWHGKFFKAPQHTRLILKSSIDFPSVTYERWWCFEYASSEGNSWILSNSTSDSVVFDGTLFVSFCTTRLCDVSGKTTAYIRHLSFRKEQSSGLYSNHTTSLFDFFRSP